MSTSRSNDLSRTWSKTNFTIPENEENVNLARQILENRENWKNPYSYAEFKNKIPRLTQKEMVSLIEQDLDMPKSNKIFQILPAQTLQSLLLNANVMQFSGKRTRRRRRTSKRRRSKNRRSKRRRNSN